MNGNKCFIGETKIVAKSSDRIVIQRTVLQKLSPLLAEIRITLPRVEMHVRALEDR